MNIYERERAEAFETWVKSQPDDMRECFYAQDCKGAIFALNQLKETFEDYLPLKVHQWIDGKIKTLESELSEATVKFDPDYTEEDE